MTNITFTDDLGTMGRTSVPLDIGGTVAVATNITGHKPLARVHCLLVLHKITLCVESFATIFAGEGFIIHVFDGDV